MVSNRSLTNQSRWTLVIAITIGGASTPTATAQCTEGCVAIHVFNGEANGDQFGWVGNDIDDIDDDGVRDIVLTAPTNGAGGASAGRAYVYSGASGEEMFRVTGLSSGEGLGGDAAGAGDFNQDGTPDVIVGANNLARIYSGVNGEIIRTYNGENTGDQFGYRVWGEADFNGDGRDDVIIGAPTADATGKAYVYSGDDESLICDMNGLGNGHWFGSGVAFVGDVNNDGRSDAVIGAMNAGPGSVGRAYVFSYDGEACNMLYELNPGTPVANFGQWFMNGEKDVNNDGTPDVYVNDYPANRAHIFSGVDGQKIWSFNGEGEGGGFGIGRLIDDVDGDGHDDALLASWSSSAGAPLAGKAFVYSGRTGEVLETFTHDVAGARFGFDANGMGDVNVDGRFDHLVTAAWDSSMRGAAYLISGNIAPITPGDGDGDGDVDTFDFAEYDGCVTGPFADGGGEECQAFDLDYDGDVDFSDAGDMQRAFTGECGITFTQQPQDIDACQGSSITLELATTGDGVNYQWRRDGLIIPGENAPTLTIDPVTPQSAAVYSASAANACTLVNSEEASVAIIPAPQVTQQPVSQSVCLGDPADFTTAATGEGSLSYQWRLNGNDIDGATDPTYSIEAVTEDDLGNYRCVVTDGCDISVMSAVAALNQTDPAVINSHPAGGDFCTGDTLFIFVGASGATTFQWYKDGNAIPGANSAFFSISNLQTSDSGSYTAEAIGECNTVVSNPAVVLVEDCP